MALPFTFDEETHICRDLKTGLFIPTVSQVNSYAKLSFDYRKLPDQENLSRRSKIGTAVHNLTDIFDAHGDIDPSWLDVDTGGYVESYIWLRERSGFAPVRWSTRRCELINGLPLSGETDKEGMIGKHEAIVDLKTGTTKDEAWGFQLAPYEMLKFQSSRIGRVLRLVAWLHRDGSPGEFIEYGEFSKVDGISYADTFLAALHSIHAAIRRGNVTERDFTE